MQIMVRSNNIARQENRILISENIRILAESTGIDVIGFAQASEFRNYALNNSRRADPALSLHNAKSIIVAGIYIGGLKLSAWNDACYGRTSRLYLSEFFLDVVKPLSPILSLLNKNGYEAVICKSSTKNESILPLKLAAIRAGLGWQGKNSLLISRKYGTFLALGGIITDAVLEYNTEEESNHCGTCRKCQEACPLDALDQPYVLKMKQCLSYLLQVEKITKKAEMVSENKVSDCEICQNVCSWNKKHIKNPIESKMTNLFESKIKNWEDIFYLPNLVKMTEKDYKNILGKLNTGIPYKIFHRNVLSAYKKSQDR